MRRQLFSQVSCFIRDAKRKAKTRRKTVTRILMETITFFFFSNVVEPVQKGYDFASCNFESYCCINSTDRVLLVRDTDTICIHPGNQCLYIIISESLALRALELFGLTGIIDVDDILLFIEAYCQQRNLALDIEKNKEILKLAILDRRIEIVQAKFFTCTVLLDDPASSTLNEANVDLDALLGPIYFTRVTKGKSQLVPLDSESSDSEKYSDDQDDLWQSNLGSNSKKRHKQLHASIKTEELRRKFLHIKDEHYITDSAIKAMYKFFQESKETFYSMGELERVRSESNRKVPLKFTRDSAYVPFEFALRSAIFVAIKFRPELLHLNQLSFRLNMDGTLMGNKHVVAVSVNCIDGGSPCQTAKRLVLVGIFEIHKESNESLRKALPKDFLNSIRSVKCLNVTRKKSVAVKVRLGGDYQNAVYVFGLAGVHSNYPCLLHTKQVLLACY